MKSCGPDEVITSSPPILPFHIFCHISCSDTHIKHNQSLNDESSVCTCEPKAQAQTPTPGSICRQREHVAVMSHAVLFVSKAATPTK